MGILLGYLVRPLVFALSLLTISVLPQLLSEIQIQRVISIYLQEEDDPKEKTCMMAEFKSQKVGWGHTFYGHKVKT